MRRPQWWWWLSGLPIILAVAWWWPVAVPSFETVRATWVPSDAWLLDRHGEILDSIRLRYDVRRSDWTALADTSPSLLAAVVEGEDHRFWQHHGIDWYGVGGALRDQLLRHRRRGASTISMQLASALQGRTHASHGMYAWWQKWQQARMARAIEAHWNKQQILEAYLNLINFRGELQGIGAAATVLAAKNAASLSIADSRVLAALLPDPAASPATVARRACRRTTDAADCEAVKADAERMLANPPASIPASNGDAHWAPAVARQMLHTPGQRVTTTLDARLQRAARELLDARLAELADHNVRDGAILLVDNASGEVLAYVGSGGRNSRSSEVDGVRALRQAGSTLKPFLYEMAIEGRYLNAASLLEDSPLSLQTPNGVYIPQDYDHDFKGTVSARTALAGSLNVPAVRTLLLVGVDAFRNRLHDLGYQHIVHDGQYYGYALALGSPEVSLWEQVQAYRSLALAGQWSPIRIATGNDDSTPAPTAVMSTAAAFIVADVLADRAARSVTFGLDNALVTPFWSAAKTGTSDNMRDNWCIGFSRHYTIGVWVGNFEGDSMVDVSGVTGAASIWHDLLALVDTQPDSAPQSPAGVESRHITFSPQVEAPRHEWFLAGQGADNLRKLPAESMPHIATPANGMVIVLDPDIPPARERVLISTLGTANGSSLQLNGRSLGPAYRSVLWAPLPGQWDLTLVDAGGKVLDRAHFLVRRSGGSTPNARR